MAEGDSSLLTAEAEDSQGRKYSSVLEYVGPLNRAPGIVQIILKIPDESAHIGDVIVKVARSTSNKVHVMLFVFTTRKAESDPFIQKQIGRAIGRVDGKKI